MKIDRLNRATLLSWQNPGFRAGLTMVEVLVSTVVMATLLASLLSFVDSATRIWQRTDQNLTLSAEASQILDSLRLYTSIARTVSPIGGSAGDLRVVAFIATGTPGAPDYRTGLASLLFCPQPDNPRRLIATYTAGSVGWGANPVTFVTNAETLPQHVSLRRFTGVLTDHLASFSATRINSGQMDIYLRLEAPTADQVARTDPNYATPSYETTSTLFLPPSW
jgi:hypothetical protein